MVAGSSPVDVAQKPRDRKGFAVFLFLVVLGEGRKRTKGRESANETARRATGVCVGRRRSRAALGLLAVEASGGFGGLRRSSEKPGGFGTLSR